VKQNTGRLPNSLPQIIFEIDLNVRVTYINPIGLSKFGYSSDVISKNLRVTDFIVEKETLCRIMTKIS
jgi:PAS domain-containing protein